MPIRVQIGKRIVEFPDGTSQDVMKAALLKLPAEAEPWSSKFHDPNPGTDDGGKPTGDIKSPTTFWGGVSRHISDSLVNNPLIQHAAQPRTGQGALTAIGDVAPLALLDAPEGLFRSIRPIAKAAYEGAKDAPTLRSMPRLALKSAWKNAERFVPQSGPESATIRQAAEDAARAPADLSGKGLPNPLNDLTDKAKGATDLTPTDALGRPLSAPVRVGESPVVPATAERTRVGMEPYRPSPKAPFKPGFQPRHVGPAPTVEDELLKALEAAKAPESPEVTTGSPDVETAGEGALKQSGKFGKSGNLGQARGYTSGNPATPALEEAAPAHDAVLENAAPVPEAAGEPAPWDPSWAGSEEPSSPFHDTENPEWHSGAEPGSPEARQAQSSHQYEREMDEGYRRRILDSRGSVSTEDMIKLLLGGLAGGAAAGATSRRP